MVQITRPDPAPGNDTAAVKLLSNGRSKPDGSDYRVLDAAGKPVPFRRMFHDSGTYTWIAFRASAGGGRFFVYFDNPSAARSPDENTDDPAPGAGPPRGAWVPRRGLLYTTLRRPEGDNPRTFAAMAALIARSPGPEGARYQRKISDGYNPFGSTDHFISIYRGWMAIPQAGRYDFATASNEASFAFMDGKPLVAWPGRHTEARGARGEKHHAVDLTAGPHYVEYYHENVALSSMAFLAWKPPGAAQFAAIPESVYTQPHLATASAYEAPSGAPLATFEPQLLDTIWPEDRPGGQYTRYLFQAATAAPGARLHWDFGDGLAADGPRAEHVFLKLGHYDVTLTAAGPAGSTVARWPLDVFEVQEVTPEFKEGKYADYGPIIRTYDRARLKPELVLDLAYLLAETGRSREAVATAESLLGRGAAVSRNDRRQAHRLIAEAAIQLGDPKALEQVIRNLREALDADDPAADQILVLSKLIRLVGIDANQPEKALELWQRVSKLSSADPPRDPAGRAALRAAAVAMGDVLLEHAQADEAYRYYELAETLNQVPFPPQVRAARVGSFPNAIRDRIEAKQYTEALDVLNTWERDFPNDKPKGEIVFWRGKLSLLLGKPAEAIKPLGLALQLAPGSDWETEAGWLLAQALEARGDHAKAQAQLRKLAASGIRDGFTAQARAKVQRGGK